MILIPFKSGIIFLTVLLYPWLLVHGFGFKLNHLNSIDERFFIMYARFMVKTFESALITTIPKRYGLRLRR
jgi:hypothetical protein